MAAKEETQPIVPNYLKFAFGGLAGMSAVAVVQPLDLVKNRMQMSGIGGSTREHRTSLHAFRSIYTKEGILGFYNGLSAGLFRQGTYGTIRLGLYTWGFETITKSHHGTHPSLAMKAGLGMCAGGISALICTPSEVALIRMTTDGRLPIRMRRGYTNVFNALYRITTEEGIAALWRGCAPTVIRAIIVNAAQLGSYSQAKEMLIGSNIVGDNIICHFYASTISGVVTAVASTPVDVVKTRIQTMQIESGTSEYKGAADAFANIIRNEGILSLWKGLTVYTARLAPYTVLAFVFLEEFNRMYFNYVLGVKRGSVGL